MATPLFTTNLTTISDCDGTAWTTIGTTKAVQYTETKVQGIASIGFEAKTGTGLKGLQFDLGSTNISAAHTHFYAWVLVSAPDAIETLANGGVRLRITDNAGNYSEWYVGGSNTPWTSGGWKRCSVNVHRAPDANSGTLDLATARYFGITLNMLVTLGKLPGGYIDIMHYGHTFHVWGGSNADPVVLQDIVDQDGPAGLDTSYGVIAKNKAGIFEVNGEFTIGDDTTGSTVFSSVGDIVVFSDQPFEKNFPKWSLGQGSGSTRVVIGESVGADETKVGLGGTTFFSEGNVIGDSGAEYHLDFDSGIDVFQFYGSTIQNAVYGVFFGDSTGHDVLNNNFISCGQVEMRGVYARQLLFAGYDQTGDAALLWDPSIDIEESNFFGNTNAETSATAVEHVTTGEVTYGGLIFSGNNYDIDFSTGGELTVNATAGSDPTTWEGTAGGTVTINNPITHTLTDIVSGSEVTYVTLTDDYELFHVEDVQVGTTSYPYQYAGDTGVNILVFHLDYVPVDVNVTLGSLDAILPIQQIDDPNYFNPA